MPETSSGIPVLHRRIHALLPCMEGYPQSADPCDLPESHSGICAPTATWMRPTWDLCATWVRRTWDAPATWMRRKWDHHAT